MPATKQLPAIGKEDVSKVHKMVGTSCKGTCNIWIQRKRFEECEQVSEQSFRQFYAEIVEKASKCHFGKDYCNSDEQKAVDDRTLSKIVCGITSPKA